VNLNQQVVWRVIVEVLLHLEFNWLIMYVMVWYNTRLRRVAAIHNKSMMYLLTTMREHGLMPCFLIASYDGVGGL
jgi:hypothetical protein